MNTNTPLSDDELLARVETLLGSERERLTELIRYLAEVEDRRLHLRAGYSSMFEFCTEKHRLSEGETFRRLTAARLSRRFPLVLELLESGALHLSALVPLRDHLTEGNHAELLGAASGKNKSELLALLAARFPKPDVPSMIRKLPARKDSPKVAEQSALPLQSPAQRATMAASESPPAAAPGPAGRGRVEPLSPARYKVQFTADERLKQKLDRVTELLRHANPTGDLAAIIERAVDLLLADVEKKRLGKTERPRLVRQSDAGKQLPGAVTRAARRETYERDGERCSFVSADGKRCGAPGFLQIDHIQPRALRGTGESGNLRVVCAAHNRWFAEQIFGREHIDAAVNFRQRKRHSPALNAQAGAGVTASLGPLEASKQPTERRAADNDETYRKLLTGLTSLGFWPKQARTALDSIREGTSNVAWEAPLDVLLREALLRLTR
jgi:hypothetical protein